MKVIYHILVTIMVIVIYHVIPYIDMHNTNTHVSDDLIDAVPYLVGDLIKNKDGYVVAAAPRYTVLNIVKILHPLQGNSLKRTDLMQQSKMRMNQAFGRYVRLCLEFGMVSKEKQARNVMMYSLTATGKIFLKIFLKQD